MFFAETQLSLELLGIFKIKRGAGARDSFDRNYDSLSIRLDGCAKFSSGGTEFEVGNGDVLYLPKNRSYRQETEGETVLAIHFINYSFSSKNRPEVISVNNYDVIVKLVEEMYSEWKEKKQGYRYKCISLFYSLMHQLNLQAHEDTLSAVTQNEKLKAAVSYIHSHYRSEQMNMSRLASMCAVSDTYFRKLFKEIHGVSPAQYVINLRLEYASQLLMSRLYTILEVSEKSGFNDVKYFSKLFKKHYGVSPSEFRDIIPENEWK